MQSIDLKRIRISIFDLVSNSILTIDTFLGMTTVLLEYGLPVLNLEFRLLDVVSLFCFVKGTSCCNNKQL